ncbi:uncharacterized protein N7477_004042 [Penicillium maclennaniae]|uniref:uncharacterized protein n=1 Tax=Penicillium maclennaniae TaxID=1343394 RepID=UPI0025406577|nr:uncharacterized protein N7477_004042 [Penicillium maclennaniae]KAJ5678409.1 hypothetical protein N7477_004042 [Penicillium maclennaniae]
MSRYTDIPSHDPRRQPHRFHIPGPKWKTEDTEPWFTTIPFPFHLQCAQCAVSSWTPRQSGAFHFTRLLSVEEGKQHCRLPRAAEAFAAFDSPCLPSNGMRGALVFVPSLTLGSTSDPGCRAHLQLQGVRSRLAPLKSCVPQVLSLP